MGVHFNSNATNVNVSEDMSVSEINAKPPPPRALSFAGGAVDVWFGQRGGGGGAVHVANYGPSANSVVPALNLVVQLWYHSAVAVDMAQSIGQQCITTHWSTAL